MMSRKHYTAIAHILSNYQEVMEADKYFEMIIDFSKYLSYDNERFNAFQFMEACGVSIPKME